ncbi:MAG TPA: glycosyltransferase family 39 protein [Roseiflexaceae bacterium]|nr:glycosyltransferase family 39 protein [Roseiflexaceae bacterium]
MSGHTLRVPPLHKTIAIGSSPWKLALALGAIGVVSRWLLHGRLLYDQQAAALAFAARGTPTDDMAASGAGLLYLSLGRLLIALLGSPELAFAAISAVASGLAVIVMYALGAAIFGEIAGVLAAMLLLSSPLFWFYGAASQPYAVDVLIGCSAALISWRLACGHTRLALPLLLGLALAIGLRPWPALLMLPLALFALAQARADGALRAVQLARWLLASLLFGAIWFLPIGRLPGRWPSLDGLLDWSFDPSGFVWMLIWGWGFAALPALGALPLWALRIPGFRSGFGRWSWLYNRRLHFFVAWGLPWLLSALLVRGDAIGRPALGMPIFMLWSAGAMASFIGAGVRRMATIAATLIILVNAALFLVTPEYRMLGAQRVPSAATILYRDRRLAAAITTIRNFSASETVIVADDWLPVSYYLPTYALIPYRATGLPSNSVETPSPEHQAVAQQSAALVWFEATLDRYNASPDKTETRPMAIGTLRLLRPQPSEELVLDQTGFGLHIKPALRK